MLPQSLLLFPLVIVQCLMAMCFHNCLFIFKAMVGEECVGAIVCKLDMHKKMFRRGYIAMLAVDSKYRRNGIGKENVISQRVNTLFSFLCFETKDLNVTGGINFSR